MRIISQDGLIDVSYENGNLSMSCGKYKDVECARIYYYSSASQKGTLLAEYNSEAKAIKALEMLHEAYVGKLICKNIDMTKDVEELLKSWNTQAIITEITHSEPKIDCINNTIFKFPKAEDVEVED